MDLSVWVIDDAYRCIDWRCNFLYLHHFKYRQLTLTDSRTYIRRQIYLIDSIDSFFLSVQETNIESKFKDQYHDQPILSLSPLHDTFANPFPQIASQISHLNQSRV